MEMKSFFSHSILLAIVCIPSLAFAYGEGWTDTIPLDARQLHLLVNEAVWRNSSPLSGPKTPYFFPKTRITFDLERRYLA